MQKIFILLALLPMLFSCGGNDKPQQQTRGAMPPTTVSAIIADFQEIEDAIYSTGSLMPNEEVDLKTEIPGRITKLSFTEGARVAKGQLLIKLNDRDLKAQLSKNDAAITLAKQDEQRKKQLLGKAAISQEEYDKSASMLATAIADRDLIKAQIEKTEIYAPFNGIIGLKYVSEGANVIANTSIANFIQLDPIKIEFSVPEKYASQIKVNTDIEFFTSDQKKFNAKVYAVEGKIDANTRSYRVRAKCSNSKQDLIPGSFVKIRISLQKIQDAIVLPAGVIVNELSGNKIYVAKGGIAKSIAVETGIRTDKDVQIISGISKGDTVLTSGLMQVKDNSPIIVKPINGKQ